MSETNPRKYARYNIDGEWREVHADKYDPAVHGTDLRCTDPACNGSARHRSFEPGTTHAGSTAIGGKYFYAPDRRSHREGCSWLAPVNPFHRTTISMDDALETGARIIFNLGFQVGHPMYRAYGSARQVEEMDTDYNRWRRAPHASVSIKSIHDFIREIEKIHTREPGALRNIFVAHAQDIRPARDFYIDENPEKFLQLVQQMYEGKDYRAPHYNRWHIFDFTRLFVFRPSADVIMHPSGRWLIEGKPVIAHDEAGSELTICHRAELSSGWDRKSFLRHDTQEVIATPMLERNQRTMQVLDAFFRASRNSSVTMHWRVMGRGQFQPAPHARSRNLVQQIGFFNDADETAPSPE